MKKSLLTDFTCGCQWRSNPPMVCPLHKAGRRKAAIVRMEAGAAGNRRMNAIPGASPNILVFPQRALGRVG